MRYLFPGTKTFIKFIVLMTLIMGIAMFPGHVHLTWLGHEADMPIAVWLAAVLSIIACVIALYHLWHALRNVPSSVRDFFSERRKQRGEKLLIEGLTAIAAHQPEEANQSIQFASSLIPENPLTLFIAAQSAHLAKDHNKAQEYFYEMIKNPRMAFLGYRGLTIQAQEQNDWVKAQSYLEEAFKLRPDSPWVVQEMTRNALFLSQSRILSEFKSLPVYRYLAKDHLHRHEALMAWLQSKHYAENTKIYEELLLKSHKLDPSIILVTISLMDFYLTKGEDHLGQKVIIQSYKVFPHRDLARVWMRSKSQATPLKLYQHLEKLTYYHPTHPESQWALAEAAVDAQLWGQARGHLERLLIDGDRDDVCQLMALIEQEENPNNQELIDGWKNRAKLIRHFSWVCQECQHIHTEWQVFCIFCHAIDRIEWILTTHEEISAGHLPKEQIL